jgi:hypothetical protein
MKTPRKIPLSVLPDVPTAPLLLGYHPCRLGSRRRLRLPADWFPNDAPTWLLFPLCLFDPRNRPTRYLMFLPADDMTLHKIIHSVTPPLDNRQPPLSAALATLRASARQRSLAPALATVLRIGPATARITLTKAQLTYLGSRKGNLAFTGMGTFGHIFSAAEWAKFKRKVSRELA